MPEVHRGGEAAGEQAVMNGPGKYDEIATLAIQLTGARAVLLIVVDGDRGQGFSVKATDPRFKQQVPGLLRTMADTIEHENKTRELS